MNFVGKVLIVLNLVLCLLFMAFASAVFTAQKNWGGALTKAKDAEATLQRTIGETNEAFTQFKNKSAEDIQLLTDRAKKAEAESMLLATEKITVTGERDQARTERNAAQTESQIASEESRDRIAESEELRLVTSKLRAKIDAQIDEIRAQQDQIIAGERKLAAYELKQLDLIVQLGNQKKLLLFNDIDPDEIVDVKFQDPPPRVSGLVADARRNASRDTEYIEITLGSDDGLQKNHVLMIYRGEKYLGDIKLTDVRPDRAVGVVIQRSKNGVIGRGDNVATKI